MAALPADFLLKVGFSERYAITETAASGSVAQRGHQRRLDTKRLKLIAGYLETADATLPNTIILAANCLPDGELLDAEDKRRWVIRPGKDGVVWLTVPTEGQLAAIVDGQHRLYGFEEVEDPRRRQMPLACAVFLDLPTPQQASIFATINYNQKPVDKSQTYQLFGYNLDDEPAESWSPEKLAVFLARKLNVDEQSPLKDRIQIAAQDDRVLDEESVARSKEWSVSTATIVEAIMRLITTKAKEDRDCLHRYPVGVGRHRSNLPGPDKMPRAPLRELYVKTSDNVIYALVLNYLCVVDDLFWRKPEPGFIRKTIGIQALFDVLAVLLPEQLRTKNLTKDVWREHLRPAAKIDFTDRIFHASGSGRTRVKKALLFAMGRLKNEDIDPVLRADFARALRG